MKVAVVKYNAGNIRSVDYALKRLGVEAVITADKEELQSADKVIFPGVGEAETTMNHLKATGLDELIKNLRQPVFGICLGMQLMCRYSEEGEVDCLNIFDVDVKRFVPQKHEDKVPHMGWNTIGKTNRVLPYYAVAMLSIKKQPLPPMSVPKYSLPGITYIPTDKPIQDVPSTFLFPATIFVPSALCLLRP